MKISLIIIFFTNTIAISGQNIFGKWYNITKSGLLEFDIQANQIIQKKLTFDFLNKEKKVDTIRIEKIIDKQSNGVLIISSLDAQKAMVYCSVKYSNLIYGEQVSMFGGDTTYSSAHIAFKRSNNNVSMLNFYSQDMIISMNKWKAYSTMNKEDFKIYLNTLYKIKLQMQPLFDKSTGYGIFTLISQLKTKALIELKYNPLIFHNEIDALFEKYQEESDIKPILEKLKNIH